MQQWLRFAKRQVSIETLSNQFKAIVPWFFGLGFCFLSLSVYGFDTGTVEGEGGGFTLGVQSLFFNEEGTEETTTSKSVNTFALTSTAITFGYQFSFGAYVGIISSGRQFTPVSNQSVGGTIGWIWGSWNLWAHILANGVYKTSSSNVRFVKGSGVEVNFGYTPPILGSLRAGVFLVYRTMAYPEREVDGVKSSTTVYNLEETHSVIRLGYTF